MLRRLSQIRNAAVVATDGEIGKLKDIYFDDRSWRGRYVIVDTESSLMGRRVVLPPSAITAIDVAAGRLHVSLSKDQIEQSPGVDDGIEISRAREEEWHRHFGLSGYWGAPQVDVLTAAAVPSAVSCCAMDQSKQEPRSMGAVASTTLPSAPSDAQLWSSSEIKDYAIHATDGDVGRVQDFLVEDSTWQVRYFVVLRSWLAGTETLIPPSLISRISLGEMKVFLRVRRDAVVTAPVWDGADPPAATYEEAIRAHYESLAA